MAEEKAAAGEGAEGAPAPADGAAPVEGAPPAAEGEKPAEGIVKQPLTYIENKLGSELV